LLEESIKEAIVSHYTNTVALPIDEIVNLGSRGTINIVSRGTTTTLSLNSAAGVKVGDIGTDALAKALWNFYLIEQDQSFGIHNPDFTFLVLGESKFQADRLREP
jgi:hypothetical protein